MSRKALIIGCGVGGPVAAMFLKRAGIDPVIYEARARSQDDEGAFLGLAPNGQNVLKQLGIGEQLVKGGIPTGSMVFWSSNRRRLGELDMRMDSQRYGAQLVQIKRGTLHNIVRQEAERQGIEIRYGKRLSSFDITDERKVVACFEDGSQHTGDFLIGSDGIHSRTREILLPQAPRPEYTGMIDLAGFTYAPHLSELAGPVHMTFGKRGFCGYQVKSSGEVYWFTNVPHAEEPVRGAFKNISQDELRESLLRLYADEPYPIPEIIESTKEIGIYPLYDIPSLPVWHKGPVCLIGDAAHATTPHAGHGASSAIEDAIVLAKCLRDIPGVEDALAAFQDLRKERVEKLVRRSRRIGNSKTPSNRVTRWMRDSMMSLFIKFGGDRFDRWVFEYKVDWDEKVSIPVSS